jgi:diguanylate cyclase (GGDEF)-like protein
MYTVITLFLQRFTVKSIDRHGDPLAIDRLGIFFFSLLAVTSMAMQIELNHTSYYNIDLKLAVLTLAGIYLRLPDCFLVGLVTIVFRFYLSGFDALRFFTTITDETWWAIGAPFYGSIARAALNYLPFRQLNLFFAAIINTIVFIGILELLSLKTHAFDYISPFVSPVSFRRMTLTEFCIIPVSTIILDWCIKKALIYKHSYTTLEIKANYDGMTGLVNHRHFQELLTKVLATASPSKPVSLLIIDIDYFKQYNDSFGHQNGDLLLQELAVIFPACIRSNDIAARYGGEEFVVILPDADHVKAFTIAERIRSTVENYPFTRRRQIPQGKVSLSIGVAIYPQDATDKNALIAAADKALYRAKHRGRNRVESFSLMNKSNTEIDTPHS